MLNRLRPPLRPWASLAVMAAGAVISLAATPALAGGVSWSVGINAPIVPGVSLGTVISGGHGGVMVAQAPIYGPAPVVYAPAPIYSPPQVVYARPAPVYGPPVVYAPQPVVYAPRPVIGPPPVMFLPRHGHHGYPHHWRPEPQRAPMGEWRGERHGHEHHRD